ncbi:pre-mRNA-splicing factor ISY1 homolog isoform X2 [Schistocerca nitens]|uniref:pre-mRNA-splicing factor ISY1 homolog isoform X2 n=1 Tax=Schistocerca nitens TaxID=7011 RepID=UPI002117E368|nr:pre-mRNA-splicing factor ISY1 homolog isoform X2 [Schistocerca nitens]
MARNAEKAMTTLARWRAAHVNDMGKEKERRPYLASECHDLAKAEKWRLQIIREIAKKVAQIQNAGLGEFRIRDLNDEINKLLREKGHWEAQIRELGGPDYAKVGPRMLDHEGKEVPGNRGYKYFGAAKDLPAILRVVAEWKFRKEHSLEDQGDDAKGQEEEEDIYAVHPDVESDEEAEGLHKEEPLVPRFIAHVPVPSQKEVEAALLARKKQELLEKYASTSLLREVEETRGLAAFPPPEQ